MATDITNSKAPITTDGDFYWTVPARLEAVVKIDFTTVGTGGTVTIKDAQGSAYRNVADSADLSVAFDSTLNKYSVAPTGGQVRFTSSGVAAGGSAFVVRVIPLDSRA